MPDQATLRPTRSPRPDRVSSFGRHSKRRVISLLIGAPMPAPLRLSVDRLVDVTDHPTQTGAALLIEGERLASIGPDDAIPRPADAVSLAFPAATPVPRRIDAH